MLSVTLFIEAGSEKVNIMNMLFYNWNVFVNVESVILIYLSIYLFHHFQSFYIAIWLCSTMCIDILKCPLYFFFLYISPVVLTQTMIVGIWYILYWLLWVDKSAFNIHLIILFVKWKFSWGKNNHTSQSVKLAC